MKKNNVQHNVCVRVCACVCVCERDLPLFLSLRWSVSRTVLMERLLMTLPGVTYGSVSGSMLG